jgi:tetratricopeptide (TPR) repeat protein
VNDVTAAEEPAASPFAEATHDTERYIFGDDAKISVPIPTEQKYTKEQLQRMLDDAIVVHQRGEVEQAMRLYREVLFYDRTNRQALYFATIALSQQNHPEEKVVALMKHAVANLPNVPEAHYNLGILFHRMGKEADARDCFLKAVALLPGLTEAKTSLGGAFLNLGDKALGRRWLEAAANTTTGKADSVYSRAFARLTIGRIYDGFVDYDSRWKTASFLVENRRNFGNARHWNGKPIPGKTLYIHTEQGAGDVVMFSRFIPRVAERSKAKTIVFEVAENLVDFLAQIPGVDYVIPSNTAVPDEAGKIDHYLPMMGMMRKVGFFDYKDVPARDGWLGVMDAFAVEVPPGPLFKPLRVGIAWAGSKAHKNDRYRSIPWAKFRDEVVKPLHDTGKFQFYSFQVGERARDMNDGGDGMVIDLTSQLKTYAHTAHALSQMDIVLSVDTATVHVAAALVDGPAVHTLIPAAPDWRWLLEGSTTPWYSRLTLHRQDKAEEWSPALTSMVTAAMDFHSTVTYE